MNFPSQIFFKDINHGYRAAILKKILCVSFHFIWCGYLFLLLKGAQKDVHFNCIRPS